jgi:transposase
MSVAGMGPAFMISGATDAQVFEGYIEHILVPSLRPGQIVILDNLSAHKGQRVRDLIATRGCHLWYLPPYSPDLSPIEYAFAKLKAWLRKVSARTHAALECAIADALDAITSDDAQAFFQHGGYHVLSQVAQLLCS